MNAEKLAEALRNAQVAHARQRLQQSAYWQTQLGAGLVALGNTPVGALVDQESLILVVDDWLASVDTAQGLHPVITHVSDAILVQAGKDPSTVGELLNEAHFEAILEQTLRLQSLRGKAIHACLNHPLVSEMVSEMLYTGIKNFLLEENALAKLPGVSGMMKLGRKSVGKAMGGLEHSIRDYLHHNTRATLRTGEQWLNRQLTDERIAALARDGYQRLAPLKPADAINTAPPGISNDFITHASAIADETSRLNYSRRLVAAGIRAALQSLLEKNLPELLKAMGTTAEKRVQTLAPALAANATALDQQGVLELWLDQAVGDFYASDACKEILENALAQAPA